MTPIHYLAALLGLLACEQSAHPPATPAVHAHFSWTIDALPVLPDGQVYALWAGRVDEGEPAELLAEVAVLDVDEEGRSVGEAEEPDAMVCLACPDSVVAVVVRANPASAEPSVVLLAGLYVEQAHSGGPRLYELTTAHPLALAVHLSDVQATYTLDTPTTSSSDDWYNGVWWSLSPDVEPVGPESGYPPDGWSWEGWIVDGPGLSSTGRFSDPFSPDSDGAGPAAGPLAPPAAPGQDYVSPPRDLRGLSVWLTLEPPFDDGPEPFLLVMVGDVIADSQVATPLRPAVPPAGIVEIDYHTDP